MSDRPIFVFHFGGNSSATTSREQIPRAPLPNNLPSETVSANQLGFRSDVDNYHVRGFGSNHFRSRGSGSNHFRSRGSGSNHFRSRGSGSNHFRARDSYENNYRTHEHPIHHSSFRKNHLRGSAPRSHTVRGKRGQRGYSGRPLIERRPLGQLNTSSHDQGSQMTTSAEEKGDGVEEDSSRHVTVASQILSSDYPDTVPPIALQRPSIFTKKGSQMTTSAEEKGDGVEEDSSRHVTVASQILSSDYPDTVPPIALQRPSIFTKKGSQMTTSAEEKEDGVEEGDSKHVTFDSVVGKYLDEQPMNNCTPTD